MNITLHIKKVEVIFKLGGSYGNVVLLKLLELYPSHYETTMTQDWVHNIFVSQVMYHRAAFSLITTLLCAYLKWKFECQLLTMVWCHTQLVSSLSTLGDLSFSSSSKNDGYGLGPSLGSGLMKSKSDHRLAAQFRDQEDTYGYSGRTSPLMRRRFGERNVERYSLSHLLPTLYPLNQPNIPLTQQLRPLKWCYQPIMIQCSPPLATHAVLM